MTDKLVMTDDEFLEWCGTHTVENCRGTRNMEDSEGIIRIVDKCEDCRGKAQLLKAIPIIREAVEAERADAIAAAFEQGKLEERIRVAEEIKEILGENVFEPILNFYVRTVKERKAALILWRDFWKRRLAP